MTDLYFEDFTPGVRFESRGKTITESEIIDFAFRYDPQPFHLDVNAARDSTFGGLIASGFLTIVVAFRMMWDTGVFRACSLGSPGFDELRWIRPVRPGDTLRTTIVVIDARPSSSKPDRGTCRIKYTVLNQDDEAVMSMVTMQILARRPETDIDNGKSEAAP